MDIKKDGWQMGEWTLNGLQYHVPDAKRVFKNNSLETV